MAHSKHPSVFKMDATTGATAVTDYSTEVISMKDDMTKNSGVFHTIGAFWQNCVEGGGGLKVDVETPIVGSASSFFGILRTWLTAGLARSVEMYTPDASAGSFKISGEFRLVNLTPLIDTVGGSGDVQKSTATLQSDGTVTFAVAT